MDSIDSYEFHKIFDRLSKTIDLKGQITAEDIEEELVKARNSCKRLAERADSRKGQALYNSKKIALNNLLEYGFAERVITEAQRDPHGQVALTLRYGHREAKRRLLAQARTGVRMRLLKRR